MPRFEANFTNINNEIYNYFASNRSSLLNPYSNPQDIYDKVTSYLRSTINKFVPFRTESQKIYRKPRHIKNLLRQKQKLYKKLKNNKNLRKDYKEVCKSYDLAVQKWYDYKESKICNNPSSKKFFNFFSKRLKSKNNIPPLYDENDDIKLTDLDKAELLNKFFQSVYTQDDNSDFVTMPKTTINMSNFEISSNDIVEAAEELKDKITKTPESISSYFIKRIIPSILPFLVFIFNRFLQSNVVPRQWKSAIVIPVFKKGDLVNQTITAPYLSQVVFHDFLKSFLIKKYLIISNLILFFRPFSSDSCPINPLVPSCLTAIMTGVPTFPKNT